MPTIDELKNNQAVATLVADFFRQFDTLISKYLYALAGDAVQKGNVRETFFANQLKAAHKIQYPEKGDFLVNGTHTFEVGGKNKGGVNMVRNIQPLAKRKPKGPQSVNQIVLKL